MASTLPIALQTLQPASPIIINSTAVPTGLTTSQLVINRNVGVTPLESLSSSQIIISFWVEFSQDAGSTWGDRISGDTMGGVNAPNKFGVVGHTTGFTVSLPGNPANSNRRVRGQVSTAQTVTISGSLTLS